MPLRNAAEKTGATSPRPCIWAVGGGKGGVGKSVVTTNLAVALARSGKKCILIDADLGGANLHTLFNIPNPDKSLTDILLQRASSLEEILVPTPVPGLQLVSGSKPLFEMANPHYQQKLKLIRQIFALDADYIFLDLGTGSAFNVLDFFLAAHRKLVVVTPMPTAVENAYHFLKAAYFRYLKSAARKAGLNHQLERLLRARKKLGIRSPRDLAVHLSAIDEEKTAVLEKRLKSFRPGIVVNQICREQDETLGAKMARAAGEYFSVDVDFLGNIYHDTHVQHAVQSRKPVLEMYPQSAFSASVQQIRAQVGNG